jgi:four helix bundle protein
MKHFTFESMPVWQIAMDIAVLIFEITKTLPRSEDYGLTSQIRRSALSISANIAEGFGRQTPLDKKRFYQIANGSLLETKSHYIYGCRVAYFEEQTNVFQLLDSTHYELNKLIKSIKNSLQ